MISLDVVRAVMDLSVGIDGDCHRAPLAIGHVGPAQVARYGLGLPWVSFGHVLRCLPPDHPTIGLEAVGGFLVVPLERFGIDARGRF